LGRAPFWPRRLGGPASGGTLPGAGAAQQNTEGGLLAVQLVQPTLESGSVEPSEESQRIGGFW
jgi:hypothetical protein